MRIEPAAEGGPGVLIPFSLLQQKSWSTAISYTTVSLMSTLSSYPVYPCVSHVSSANREGVIR